MGVFRCDEVNDCLRSQIRLGYPIEATSELRPKREKRVEVGSFWSILSSPRSCSLFLKPQQPKIDMVTLKERLNDYGVYEIEALRADRAVPRRAIHLYCQIRTHGVDRNKLAKYCPRDANLGGRLKKGQKQWSNELQRESHLVRLQELQGRGLTFEEEEGDQVEARYLHPTDAYSEPKAQG